MTPEREALEAARKDIEDHCRIVGRQYNRATKKYEWNDELWRQSDPGSFAVVQKIDMALATLSAAPGEPCAWGRVIDGKAVTVSLTKTGANDEPLYGAPQPAAGWDGGRDHD